MAMSFSNYFIYLFYFITCTYSTSATLNAFKTKYDFCDRSSASKSWRDIAAVVNHSLSNASSGGSHVAAVMQITDPIGDYASNFLMLTALWCEERNIPLFVYDALPGCNGTHPTPGSMDNRFGKVWILSNLMRQLIEKSSNHTIEWLLWVDSDILILDDQSTNKQFKPASPLPRLNFVQDLVRVFSDQDLIVADQRDSQQGDINAGLILMKKNSWSFDFLDTWWNHEDAQQGEYEQRVFSTLWLNNTLSVRQHTSLVPMHVMNSPPGPWWLSASKQRNAVLHLMQRSNTVRLVIGATALSRYCSLHSFGSVSVLTQDDGSGDWVLESSLLHLFRAMVDLILRGVDSDYLKDSGRVFSDLFLLVSSKEFKQLGQERLDDQWQSMMHQVLSTPHHQSNSKDLDSIAVMSENSNELSFLDMDNPSNTNLHPQLHACLELAAKSRMYDSLHCLFHDSHTVEILVTSAQSLVQLSQSDVYFHQAMLWELLAGFSTSSPSSLPSFWERAVRFRQAHRRLLYRISDPPAAQCELASTISQLANSQHQEHRDTEAEKNFKLAIKLKEDVLTANHSDVAMLKLEYVSFLQEKGRLKESLVLCEDAVSVLAWSLGETHPWVGAAVHRTAAIYLQLGERKEAEAKFREALSKHESHQYAQIKLTTQLSKHDDLIHTIEKEATAEADIEKSSEEEEEEEEGIGSVEMASTMVALGDLLRSSSDRTTLDEAIELNIKALRIFQSSFGVSSDKCALVHNNLGLAYQRRASAEQEVDRQFLLNSKHHLLTAVDIYSKLYGKEHPQVSMCENNAAGTMWKLGDSKQASEWMRKSRESLVKVYGPNHPVCKGILWALNAIQNDEPCPL